MCMIEHIWRDSVRPQFANVSVEKVIIILYARGREKNTIPCNWKEINRGYKLLATCVQHSKCTCTQKVRHGKNPYKKGPVRNCLFINVYYTYITK